MKRVFKLQTTAHMNSASYQDHEVHEWIVNTLTQIARDYPSPSNNASNGSQNGPTVDIIVEILV